MPANYDRSASFYDRLSQLVFGDALINAQAYLLPYIPPQARVLIIGGGTGRILEKITAIHPSGLDITYVELSAKMTALSRQRNAGLNDVKFIVDAIENVNLPSFDVVITPFLFDNYKQQNLSPVFEHIHQMLTVDGVWLYTDFQLTGKWWQSVMLKSMLLFFKLLCGVESWRLPDVSTAFASRGYKIFDEKRFFGDFVVSKAYKR
jgi:ubiquinone/menaquinone biosynthesis C-methylase UbiE